jgi:hypothetical protein
MADFMEFEHAERWLYIRIQKTPLLRDASSDMKTPG